MPGKALPIMRPNDNAAWLTLLPLAVKLVAWGTHPLPLLASCQGRHLPWNDDFNEEKSSIGMITCRGAKLEGVIFNGIIVNRAM